MSLARKILSFIITHTLSIALIAASFYAISISYDFVIPPISILDWYFVYGIIVTLPLIGVQFGIQLYSAFNRESTPILLIYYFQYDADAPLPHPILDPIKSKIGLLSLVLLLIGGLIAWPIYFLYGIYLWYEFYFSLPSEITPTYLRYLTKRVASAIPPLLGIFLILIALSVALIERRYISR
ncbi:MAG: hypothetical protein J7L47_00630 [Candidatus Odinarchaeota archaeon]|nr:hypothetical protein [Candidatus Odinarchaeota archaeon]